MHLKWKSSVVHLRQQALYPFFPLFHWHMHQPKARKKAASFKYANILEMMGLIQIMLWNKELFSFPIARKRCGNSGLLSFIISHRTPTLQRGCSSYLRVFVCFGMLCTNLRDSLIREYFSAFFCQLIISHGTTNETSKPRGVTGVR